MRKLWLGCLALTLLGCDTKQAEWETQYRAARFDADHPIRRNPAAERGGGRIRLQPRRVAGTAPGALTGECGIGRPSLVFRTVVFVGRRCFDVDRGRCGDVHRLLFRQARLSGKEHPGHPGHAAAGAAADGHRLLPVPPPGPKGFDRRAALRPDGLVGDFHLVGGDRRVHGCLLALHGPDRAGGHRIGGPQRGVRLAVVGQERVVHRADHHPSPGAAWADRRPHSGVRPGHGGVRRDPHVGGQHPGADQYDAARDLRGLRGGRPGAGALAGFGPHRHIFSGPLSGHLVEPRTGESRDLTARLGRKRPGGFLLRGWKNRWNGGFR